MKSLDILDFSMGRKEVGNYVDWLVYLLVI